MLFRILCAVALAFGGVTQSQAGTMDCGQVSIVNMLAGPRHGSMMRVSNASCGLSAGWICLDPDGQFLSTEIGKRMYAYLLAQYMAGNPIRLTIYDNVFPAACGGYPAIEDVRSQ